MSSVRLPQSRIAALHEAVTVGSLEELQQVLNEDCARKKKLILCKDAGGVGLLHKAVYYDLPEIYRWLIEQYPSTATLRDSEGRTPAHYSAMCRDASGVQKMLAAAGADLYATDSQGHNYKYYMENPQELELPTAQRQEQSASQLARANSKKETAGLIIKPSNIRIWIHQRDLGKLQRVLWDGHGAKLRTETCNHPRIKRFLEAVPHLMGVIRDVHSAAVNNDLEMMQDRTKPPALPVVLSSRDSNSLTALHKASGLGHLEVARYIANTYPPVVHMQDADGRTPLHYAAILKDGDDMYNMLIDAGAEESALDNRQKAAAYYRTRPNEIETRLLTTIPEAPRTSTASFPPSWDWSLLQGAGEEPRKAKKKTEPSAPVIKATQIIEPPKPATPEPAEEVPIREPTPEVKHNGQTSPIPTPPQEVLINGDQEEGPDLQDTPNEPEPIQDIENNIEPDVLRIESEDEVETEETADGDVITEDNKEPEPEPEEPPPEPEVGIIEGVVNGEDEVETLNNDENSSTGGTTDQEQPDPEISSMVESGNMEQLAAIVLNGEGDRLVGQTSDNPEIQAFLDNVPIYMSKIKRIHVAAREGSLRDLQAALDRRKFAIAKDPVSPNGASPLHVATVFGNTSIVRYLAGRFPETVQQVDDQGRTPLHYAATLADNGHYFNLLLHLGANAGHKDNYEHDADYYTAHPDELCHKQLLKNFGAVEGEDMLADKEAQTNGQVDIPLFKTEEGRYLASSLGDPLIKGLTEVANKRPEDPIAYLATYLYNFANNRSGADENGRRASARQRSAVSNTARAQPVDVVAVEADDGMNDGDDTAFSASSRDEHGQSMLHFAAARSHSRGALFQLLQETDINIGFRDELYRTARDVSIQAGVADNTREIDRYVTAIAAQGDTDKLVELLLEGYDHIIDVVDENDTPILQVVEGRGESGTVAFLHSVLTFEERRERVHHAIRQGGLEQVQSLLADEKETGSGKLLAIGKNSYGRCTLHIAVLCQQEEVVDYLANTFPETLSVGDNLERTALHYAMGVEKVESISRVLIEAGGKRVLKDLKGRQPSYYFMNKSDILRLQEEEETI